MTQDQFVDSDMFTKRQLLKAETKVAQGPLDDLKTISTKITDNDDIDESVLPRYIIEEERIEVGSVSWQTYKRFFSYAPCGLWGIAFIVLLHVIINLCNLGVSLYLAFTLTQKFVSVDEDPARDRKYNLYLTLIIIGALVSSFAGKYISNFVFMRINQRVHRAMVKSVLETHICFFEENTQGRIINRFSKDI